MEFTPETAAGRKLIQAYGDGGFRIGGERFAGSILVFPERVAPLPVAGFADITVEILAAVTGAPEPVEILVIGCGPRQLVADPGLRAGLRAAGIALDCMDTGAACRTYNVLVSESRRVAAVLIAVD